MGHTSSMSWDFGSVNARGDQFPFNWEIFLESNGMVSKDGE